MDATWQEFFPPEGTGMPAAPTQVMVLAVPVLRAGSPCTQGQARLGHHLMVVEVAIDREPVSPDALGLTGSTAFGPPLAYAAGVALGPHQLGGLLCLLQGPCMRNERMAGWVMLTEQLPAVRRSGSLELCGHVHWGR